MKIVAADTWILRLPFVRTSRDFDEAHHELVGVTLHGETGETGIGFAFVMDFGGGRAVKALVDDVLLPQVVGRSVYDGKAIWTELGQLTHRMGSGYTSFGIAAIDIALWDLRARHHGVSLARELGQVRDRVPAYGSGKAGNRLSVDELVALSAGYIDEGLQAVKLRVGMEPDEDRRRVAAVRKAVGDDVRIMCDVNERLDLPGALHLGRQLSEYDLFWYEEPINSDDVAGHARLREALPMPITAGEHLCSRAEFVRYVEAGALDVLQPNAAMVRGITECMQIGELAAAHGLGLAPHFFSELHVHVMAALPKATYLEYFPFLGTYTGTELPVEDGMVVVPTGPGHGIRFTDDTWERFRTA